ncbi:MAG: response regulator [Patescibacteria group bacterium]|nr:response regulator [Patescibacteria group bacterium]
MAKKKILCIDDTPEAPEICGKKLKEILESVYKLSPYKIIFETNGEKGIEEARNDGNIELVLLDVEFKRQKKQGDIIAKELLSVRPDLKIIVLTREDDRGKKISFGWKSNVILYVLKKELDSPSNQNRLRNLSTAVIEDYYNDTWELEYRKEAKGSIIYLRNPKRLIDNKINSYTVNVPYDYEKVIIKCMQASKEPVDISDVVGAGKHKIINNVNSRILDTTGWNTWGILTKEGCGQAQVRLLIGNVLLPKPTKDEVSKSTSYVTQAEFECFRNEMSTKLDELKRFLDSK